MGVAGDLSGGIAVKYVFRHEVYVWISTFIHTVTLQQADKVNPYTENTL